MFSTTSSSKVVEVAPSVGLSPTLRQRICDAAIQLMENIKYVNAGTVEFLVSGDEFFFIEVNPRVQVEHTITEMVTGIDIVKDTNFSLQQVPIYLVKKLICRNKRYYNIGLCHPMSYYNRRSVK